MRVTPRLLARIAGRAPLDPFPATRVLAAWARCPSVRVSSRPGQVRPGGASGSGGRPGTRPDPTATTPRGAPLTCLVLVPMPLGAEELARACSKICIKSKLEPQSKENNRNLKGSSGGRFGPPSDRRTVRNTELGLPVQGGPGRRLRAAGTARFPPLAASHPASLCSSAGFDINPAPRRPEAETKVISHV